MKRRSWTTDEVVRLKDMALRGVCCAAAAKALGRTPGSVHRRAYTEGVRFLNPVHCTDDDLKFIAANYGRMRIRDIVEAIGKSPEIVIGRARQMGLKPLHRRWTRHSDSVIKQTRTQPVADVAKRLKRSYEAVIRRRQILGVALKIHSPEWREHIRQRLSSSELRGSQGRARWAKARAAAPECRGWPETLKLNQCRILTLLDDWRREHGPDEWMFCRSLDEKRAAWFYGGRAKLMAEAGMIQRGRFGRFCAWRIDPSMIRLRLTGAEDYGAEREIRIRLKEREVAARAAVV